MEARSGDRNGDDRQSCDQGNIREDERRPAGFGIESGLSGKVRDGSGSGLVARSCIGTVWDGSGWLGIGRDRVGGGRDVSVYNSISPLGPNLEALKVTRGSVRKVRWMLREWDGSEVRGAMEDTKSEVQRCLACMDARVDGGCEGKWKNGRE